MMIVEQTVGQLKQQLMNDIKTNRDFYIAISKLIKLQEHSTRSLEEYLLTILDLGDSYQTRQALSVSEFYNLLATAFTSKTIDFDATWKNNIRDQDALLSGFQGWQATIISQIVDLHEMDEAGILKNEHRYFGVDSPKGRRWYNFDPCAFLECATAGSYGGWQEGDDTGRDYVPGPVIVLREDGTFGSQDPREIEEPTSKIDQVSWEDFCEFLLTGQYYE
ncbi:MAG: hypothetical protein GY796_05110 [Chloroflexi bacterium]|nr:hypothetical protein [Chloroflexota bacterium]